MSLQVQRSNEDCWYKEVCTLERECKNCLKYSEMEFLMQNSNLPKAKQKVLRLDIPKCDEAEYKKLSGIKDDIYNFVQDGRSLYIGSHTTGNGKTTWAIKMMHQYFDEVHEGNCFEPRALFINVPKFLITYKNFNTVDNTFEKLKKDLYDIDLVVWDDITGLDISAYDYSVLLSYIDYRSLAELANIYTGNAETIDELEDSVGRKIASRIMNVNSDIAIFKGGDLR